MTSTPLVRGKTIIPFAKYLASDKYQMKTRGRYAAGYPMGAVVHFTAGRYEGGVAKAIDTIEGGIKNGYGFLAIARTGELVQAHAINHWAYHAGESALKNIAKRLVLKGSVSDELIGIEVLCAGKLTRLDDGRYQTWFKTFVPPEEVRYVTEKEYGCPTGYYHKFTEAQEETLIKTLLWLKDNDPKGVFEFDRVVGHHEVSGKSQIGYFRKNDPGGSLSMPMQNFRALLSIRSGESLF